MDMPQDPQSMQDAAPKKTVCITEVGDGSYSVYLEGQDSEGPESMSEQQEGAAGTPATSIQEAMAMAAQLLQGDDRAEQEMGFAQGAQGL